MTEKPDTRLIQLEGPHNGVLWIKLNRPQSGNSLHPRLVAETLQAVRWADQNDNVTVIILTGNGRFFCTGMDLSNEEELSFEPGADFHQLNEALILTKKILIAAVNGPAVGYGATSIALFDLVYAVPDAYFYTPFVKWGMVPEGASSVSFVRLMGHQRAALLCLTAERISAPEAKESGLVSKILPTERFLDEVGAIAGRLAQSSAGSLLATKRLMKHCVTQDLLDANNRECLTIVEERIPSGDLHRGRELFQAAQRDKGRLKGVL
ncbi:ClpP/crotonase-like domain-containing protein [Aspergillus californicus]